MKIPRTPPNFSALLDAILKQNRFEKVLALSKGLRGREYLHWDKVRHIKPPEGATAEEWWAAIKLQRSGALKPLDLHDKAGQPFRFSVPEPVQKELHRIDVGAGGSLRLPEPITNPQTRDHYLIRSLMEEAITSSQLEGAVTTREVAKEMIRSGRQPRDNSERMILNNFITMQRISALRKETLSPAMIFEIHKLVTDKTLDDPTAAGRLRGEKEHRVVGDDLGEIFHDPPPWNELPARLETMCDFANEKTPDYFVHPAVRAIILHFWLAYDHPFVDGNGRTARALFYWMMLHHNYWLFEFISISSILRKAPAQYGLSFLHSETDDNDLTYFIIAQTEVICRAIDELHAYLDRKTQEIREVDSQLRALNLFNHRQASLIRNALKHPLQEYTIAGHAKSHSVVYQTARTDLLDLEKRGVLNSKVRNRTMIFSAPRDLPERLKKLEKRVRV